MRYDPKAITQEDRTKQAAWLWVGLPASLINVLWLLFYPDGSEAANLFGVFAATTVAFMVFGYGYDEFMQAHLWTASRWALSAAGVMMLAGVFPILDRLDLLSSIDLTMGLSIIVAVFHTALAISRWRS